MRPPSSHQPNIARSVGRIAAMLATTPDIPAWTARTCDALTAAHTPSPPTRDAEMLATDLLEGTATLSSADAAAAVGDDVELDVVLAEALSQGVDAERLCSAVIHYESHFHIGLVWLEANRMAPSFPDHTAEDLAGWGWLGLRVALRKFEPQRGHRFSTYACYRIKGAIRDGVRDEHPVPKRLLTLQRKVQATEEQLSVHLGRVPQLAEVAEHLGETLEHLTRILPRLANAASLDELEAAAAERGGAVPGSVDPTDPADLVIEAERLDAVRAALGTIDPGDAEAVRLLVCEERSMAEARRVTGLSDRELRRRSERGCAQLRHLLADWAHAG